ncbi:hypothetical protein [Haloarchaeobius sp. TZWWS8]|uniref:hypothetical protein n=1 Tax=Haloarchaeobius sp. TZWWS8 TaxID=3446121 RepID=UPI003EB7F983
MAQRYRGRHGTTQREELDLELDRETLVALPTRHPWAVRFLVFELLMLGVATTIPLAYPASELASVGFGAVVTAMLLTALVGLVAGLASAVRSLVGRYRRTRADL